MDHDCFPKLTQDINPRLQPVGRSKMSRSIITTGNQLVERSVIERLEKLKVVADYYSLYFYQPLNNRPLQQLVFCGYETPLQFWAPNRAKAWVEILCQIAKTIMFHQRQQRKRMFHQGNDISLKIPLLWMIFSIRMTWKEVIWQSAPNTYLLFLSMFYTTIIRA